MCTFREVDLFLCGRTLSTRFTLQLMICAIKSPQTLLASSGSDRATAARLPPLTDTNHFQRRGRETFNSMISPVLRISAVWHFIRIDLRDPCIFQSAQIYIFVCPRGVELSAPANRVRVVIAFCRRFSAWLKTWSTAWVFVCVCMFGCGKYWPIGKGPFKHNTSPRTAGTHIKRPSEIITALLQWWWSRKQRTERNEIICQMTRYTEPSEPKVKLRVWFSRAFQWREKGNDVDEDDCEISLNGRVAVCCSMFFTGVWCCWYYLAVAFNSISPEGSAQPYRQALTDDREYSFRGLIGNSFDKDALGGKGDRAVEDRGSEGGQTQSVVTVETWNSQNARERVGVQGQNATTLNNQRQIFAHTHSYKYTPIYTVYVEYI